MRLLVPCLLLLFLFFAVAESGPLVVHPPSELEFLRSVYASPGNATHAARLLQGEFSRANAGGGGLRQRLSTLLELRLMDLQVSVREARRARRVVHLLREEEPWFGY